MENPKFNQIDLLRGRRKELGLSEPFFIDTKKYIKKGISIGLAIISVSLSIGILFIIRSSFLEGRKSKIKIFADEYDSLQLKLNRESKELKETAKFNKKLKNSLINISSSTAFLEELKLITPKKLQIYNLEAEKNNLTIKSRIYNKDYLNIINGLLLSLQSSQFVEFAEIDLQDIKSLDEDSIKGIYEVNIQTKVTEDYKDINENRLYELGSFGLLNRLNLLKDIDIEEK